MPLSGARKAGALFMGIDVGTQSARVGVCTPGGDLLATASAPYSTAYPRPGWAEQDARDWWRAIGDASRACLGKGRIDPSRIEGISFDATSSTGVMTDRQGEPLRPAILWMDQRAVEEVKAVAATGHPVLKYVGGQDSVEWMVPKALWLKRHQPDAYAEARKIVEAADWVAFKLTGGWTASQCNATCKANYSARDGGWQETFLAALGAPELLSRWPEQVAPIGKRIGALTPAAARDMGLRSGIAVAEGGIDAHVGLLGLNALEPSRMGLIIGSSSVTFVLNDQPVYSPRFWGPYPDAILEGSWLVEAGQTSSGSIINWLVENLSLSAPGNGTEKESLLARLEEEAAAVPAGSEGLVMLDYWQGNRTPRRDPHAKGAFFGLTLAHGYRHLVRSAYEGIAFGTRHIVDTLREDGVPVRTASAGGGGIRSRIWLQLTADICGMTISVPRFADACGVLGSAVAASVGCGFHGSLRQASAEMVHDERVVNPAADPSLYAESYQKYLQLYESTRPLLGER